MREDMSKVVVERPRWGHSLPSSKTRLRIRHYDPEKDYEDLPKRVSGSLSKYIHAGDIKSFTDLLSPLHRFLRSNVGRPWDMVYSEMRENLDDRKVTGRHVFEHVEMEVETHTLIGGDGEVYILGYNGSLQPIDGFYVDPRTGLLCWRDSRPPWKQRGKSKTHAEEVNHVRLSANTGYVKMSGIWFFIEYKVFEKPVDGDQPEQTARLREIPGVSAKPVLILGKKQLSHKELKTAKLKNDHPLAVKAEVNQR